MIRPEGLLQPLEPAEIEWNDAGEPRSRRYEDPYFSAADGLRESRHVFIDGCALSARLAGFGGRRYALGELGFGAGLNFLLTWATWREHAARVPGIHYLGIDKHPLRRAELRRALARWPRLAALAGELVASFPPPIEGIHRRLFDGGRVVLDLHWADVGQALRELQWLRGPRFDSWYLDGFAPARNPSMWDGKLFTALARLSAPGATIATYSAAGRVRRDLLAAGFAVHKRPGYARKRECLAGTLAEHAPPSALSAPAWTAWDIDAERARPAPDHALVIGAGLAGAHVAAALARRAVAVTVLERGAVAGRASGNAQAVLFNRLSHERSALADFSLAAGLYAACFYAQMLREGALRPGIDGALTGGVHSLSAVAASKLSETLATLPELGAVLSAAEGSERLGQALTGPSLWQPDSGWFAAPALCRALLAHPRITLREQCPDLSIHRDSEHQWQAVSPSRRCRVRAPVLVVAAGVDSNALLPAPGLPLRTVRGQTTQLPAAATRPLRTVLCHAGYIAPAVHGEHCIGATFAPRDPRRDLRPGDHRDNIDQLARALPAWAASLAALDAETLEGRAELRCASPDYLPMLGAVPSVPRFRERFAALGRNARQTLEATGAYVPGLYTSTAHGSRGLSYAALGAEVLASEICGEAPPVPAALRRALAPARFTLRRIVRGAAA